MANLIHELNFRIQLRPSTAAPPPKSNLAPNLTLNKGILGTSGINCNQSPLVALEADEEDEQLLNL